MLDKPSIAVLPFDNLSGDPKQDYFADGIAEDLINALSRIRWLFVTARNSTFTYKSRSVDIKQIGAELGVRYVLEGSLRRGGKRVRVTTQLIDTASGNHVWAERYDCDLDDIFEVQDEITETITNALEPELRAAERNRAHRRPLENLDAWASYQRGLWSFYQFTAIENAQAQTIFRQGIDMDPEFALAHAALAYSLAIEILLSKPRKNISTVRVFTQPGPIETFGRALR
jgi:adenylate cyclase